MKYAIEFNNDDLAVISFAVNYTEHAARREKFEDLYHELHSLFTDKEWKNSEQANKAQEELENEEKQSLDLIDKGVLYCVRIDFIKKSIDEKEPHLFTLSRREFKMLTDFISSTIEAYQGKGITYGDYLSELEHPF